MRIKPLSISEISAGMSDAEFKARTAAELDYIFAGTDINDVNRRHNQIAAISRIADKRNKPVSKKPARSAPSLRNESKQLVKSLLETKRRFGWTDTHEAGKNYNNVNGGLSVRNAK